MLLGRCVEIENKERGTSKYLQKQEFDQRELRFW